MLFNSIDFVVFLPIVFGLYWSLNSASVRLQNCLILVASYTFYGMWDWRFLFLIGFSTVVDYAIAIAIDKKSDKLHRKALLFVSVITNIGLLAYFKYCNFFLESFVQTFSFFGFNFNIDQIDIILPIGISFYTFQTLSYTIDVYKSKLKATPDLIAFASFVSFFPQLVAGPIERASNLLPQFQKRRSFVYENAVNGLQQILWGLVKKVVIADGCRIYVNLVYANTNEMTGGALVVGVIFFAFQIYCDFSGYSDMAIGTAKLFGFQLKQNFNYPYFSRDFEELWKRWHISLNTWFRDYVYIPLGGSKVSQWKLTRNVLCVFGLSGIWHGADLTFVLFGLANGLLALPAILFAKKNVTSFHPLLKLKDIISMFSVFCAFAVTLVLFRASNISQAILYYQHLFSSNPLTRPNISNMKDMVNTSLILLAFITIEWLGRRKKFPIEDIYRQNRPLRWTIYMTILFAIMYFGTFDEAKFIYFQF